MKEKSVMVLLTLKNNKDTIKRCIESLLKQNYKNYEIFVVDAFSNDGSYEILKSFGNKIKLYQLKGWPPTAYNWAIKRIKKDYIALIDGDCVAGRNWIKELVKGFSSKDIFAVAGFCGTPKNVSKLQSIIGRELEDRFKKFPEYIPRAPTMNLCFETKIARKLRFDESLRVSYDTDFGYRLTKIGKMYYNKNAIIYHFHRATWKNLFRQQYLTAIFVPQLYIKHKGKTIGDHISKKTMIIQPHLFNVAILGIILSLVNPLYLNLSIAIFLLLVLLYIENMRRLVKKGSDVAWFFGMFIIRTVAWSSGLIVGIFKLIRIFFSSSRKSS
jgi:glycosyltransferase involved in cell wall biosynthesis